MKVLVEIDPFEEILSDAREYIINYDNNREWGPGMSPPVAIWKSLFKLERKFGKSAFTSFTQLEFERAIFQIEKDYPKNLIPNLTEVRKYHDK
jgi:hypothetical protein